MGAWWLGLGWVWGAPPVLHLSMYELGGQADRQMCVGGTSGTAATYDDVDMIKGWMATLPSGPKTIKGSFCVLFGFVDVFVESLALWCHYDAV